MATMLLGFIETMSFSHPIKKEIVCNTVADFLVNYKRNHYLSDLYKTGFL